MKGFANDWDRRGGLQSANGKPVKLGKRLGGAGTLWGDILTGPEVEETGSERGKRGGEGE